MKLKNKSLLSVVLSAAILGTSFAVSNAEVVGDKPVASSSGIVVTDSKDSNVNLVETIKSKEIAKPTETIKIVDSTKAEDLIWQKERVKIRGAIFEIASNKNTLTKDSVVSFVREDGSIKEFKSTNDTSNLEIGGTSGGKKQDSFYFFKIVIDEKDSTGLWKLDSLNGTKVKDSDIYFRVYASSKEADFARNGIKRIVGKDRYQTALTIAKEIKADNSYIVLADGDNFADALYGGPLATALKARILLTSKSGLNDDTREYIRANKIKKAYILGGVNSVSKNVEAELAKMKVDFERIAGQDRIQTANKIDQKKKEILAKDPSDLKDSLEVYSSGYNFADALSSAPMVHYTGISSKGHVSFLPYDKTKYKNISTKQGYAIGGESSVPAYQNKLMERISGKDRYETAMKVADHTYNILDASIKKNVFIASGENFPDALSASPMITENNGVLLLTNKDKMSEMVKEFFASNHNLDKVYIIGGTGSISEKTFESIATEYIKSIR